MIQNEIFLFGEKNVLGNNLKIKNEKNVAYLVYVTLLA